MIYVFQKKMTVKGQTVTWQEIVYLKAKGKRQGYLRCEKLYRIMSKTELKD